MAKTHDRIYKSVYAKWDVGRKSWVDLNAKAGRSIRLLLLQVLRCLGTHVRADRRGAVG